MRAKPSSVGVLLLCLGMLALACGRSRRSSSSVGGSDAGGDASGDAGSDAGVAGAAGSGGWLPEPKLDWVAFSAGSFEMGGGNQEPPEGVPVEVFTSDAPIHRVSLAAFELTRSEVTVAQYRACVMSGTCTAPDAGSSANYCSASSGENNWLAGDRESHPVNCVSPAQAAEFCAWAGGRLPSEAEWEYAARSGGQVSLYAWGDEAPSCDLAAIRLPAGCGTGSMPACECGNVAAPVCSEPDGNTKHGLCDITGNVAELVEDAHHASYERAPTDGSAWGVGRTSSQGGLVRGGSYKEGDAFKLRVTSRSKGAVAHALIGVRCAR